MIHFACPNCKLVLQTTEQKAGKNAVCPQCRQPLLIPNPLKPKLETAAQLLSLILALALVGFLGWFIWIFPSSLSQPSEQPSPAMEQLANLDQISPLPLVPEVERSQPDVSVPVWSRIPPPPNAPAAAKKNPSDPPSKVESRPPELKPPPANRKGRSQEKRPSPSSNRGDADSLGEELVRAAPEQQEGLLEELRRGKGPEYTQALAAAIGQLSGEVKEKARRTLTDRLTRFTANTLLAYLGSENPELRRAAILALGMKDEKDHVSELVDMLEDPEPVVVEAAHAALQKLTSQKAAMDKRADVRPTQTPESRERPAPSRRPNHIAKAQPPAKDSQAPKAKQPKQDDDLPDVSLVPPEETSSEGKAMIRANTLALFSKRASERIEAAQVLGGLGEAGKPARRALCAAMLDPVIAVRVASADALKNIDPKMHYLAVLLATEKVANNSDAARIVRLLERIQKLEEDGEPLAPLVVFVVKFAVDNRADSLLKTALTTLSRIGRKDLTSYRAVATALTNRDAQVRAIALRGLARMKHGKLAASRILALLRIDVPANRVAAIEALTALADESTEEIIAESIAAQRYHDDEEVRRAVSTALNKLESKQAQRESKQAQRENKEAP